MSYTHRVDYTKNVLDGPMQGCQLLASSTVQSAYRACQLALHLNSAGILRDRITGASFTAHNIHIWPIERELPDLVGEWESGLYAAADLAYDAMVEAAL